MLWMKIIVSCWLAKLNEECRQETRLTGQLDSASQASEDLNYLFTVSNKFLATQINPDFVVRMLTLKATAVIK